MLTLFVACSSSDEEEKSIETSENDTTKEGKTQFICRCVHSLEGQTEIEVTLDTLSVLDKESADIECSNYGTTDDLSETIDCQLAESKLNQ